MSGLFSTFNVAKRGMFTQQRAIDVTSHNIANANTPGYSRQRVIIETTRPFAMPSLNNVAEPGQLGTGSQVSAIQRYRDVFLDYQTRVETSTKGQYDARQNILGEIESIFNEPSDTALSTTIGKFFDSWQQLSKQPNSSNARTVVAQQSSALADNLNQLSKKLTDLKSNVQEQMRIAVVDLNSYLKQIDQLNQQIKGVTVAGNKANDLMDKRDLLIDQLSAKFNIDVNPQSFDGVDIKPIDTTGLTPPLGNLIQANNFGKGSTFSYINNIVKDTSDVTGQTYTITYNKLGDQANGVNTVTMSVKVTNPAEAAALKELDQNRIIWADASGTAIDSTGNQLGSPINVSQLVVFKPSSGELKGYQSSEQDIDDYMGQLDNLAKAIAFSVNAVHSGAKDPLSSGNPSTYDTTPFFVKGGTDANSAKYNPVTHILTNGGLTGVVLQSENEITAGNISFNKELLYDPMKIKTRTNDDQFDYEIDNDMDGESDGARALAIASLRDKLITIQNIGITITKRSELFTAGGNDLLNNGLDFVNNTNGMKIDNYFKDTIDRVGIQSQEAQRIVKNQDALLNNFEESRASISGVSLDEEMANLVQFQHAYQANAKIIATVDELLDVVVNGLKR